MTEQKDNKKKDSNEVSTFGAVMKLLIGLAMLGFGLYIVFN